MDILHIRAFVGDDLFFYLFSLADKGERHYRYGSYAEDEPEDELFNPLAKTFCVEE